MSTLKSNQESAGKHRGPEDIQNLKAKAAGVAKFLDRKPSLWPLWPLLLKSILSGLGVRFFVYRGLCRSVTRTVKLV